MPPELVILSESALLVIIAVSIAVGGLVGWIFTARIVVRHLDVRKGRGVQPHH